MLLFVITRSDSHTHFRLFGTQINALGWSWTAITHFITCV